MSHLKEAECSDALHTENVPRGRLEHGSDSASCVSAARSAGTPLNFKEGDPGCILAVSRPEHGYDSASYVSAARSAGTPLNFKEGDPVCVQRTNEDGSDFVSCVSEKGDISKGNPLNVGEVSPLTLERLEHGSDSASCVSAARSAGTPLNFKEGDPGCILAVSRPEHGSDSASYVSAARSAGTPLNFKEGDPVCVRTNEDGSDFVSCVSEKSDISKGNLLNFGEVSPLTLESRRTKTLQDLSSTLPELRNSVFSFMEKEWEMFTKILHQDKGLNKDVFEVVTPENKYESNARDGALNITLHILREIKQTELAITLENRLFGALPVCQSKVKSALKIKVENVFEGIEKHGRHVRLHKIYTELYITEGGSGEINTEHEVKQIETAAKRPASLETPIKCEDIFQPLPGQGRSVIRSVLTKGVAGIGKTFAVHKFILDWVEEKSNQDIQLVFSMPFRELNLLSEKNYSLTELLHFFVKELKESQITDYQKYNLLFILDGLDECRIPLNFASNVSCHDVTKSISLDALLTNLIKGNLLPSALVWITSRPAAANLVPTEYVHRVTEVRGFNEPQRDEYFMKKIDNETRANRIVKHLKSTRSLYIMCHIPIFSWISATVLEKFLEQHQSGEMPRTQTGLYTYFVIGNLQTKTKFTTSKKRQAKTDSMREDGEMIRKLGKLAFEQLEKGNVNFYEADLRECDIDVREAAWYSGLCTQIFRKDLGWFDIYSFVHLSIQEFLAALYVLLTFCSKNVNLLDDQKAVQNHNSPGNSVLLKSAVDKALESQTGRLDLFLRFLLGLSLESNQTLLRGLSLQVGCSKESHEETVIYIQEKIRENHSTERCINLFHCLNELNEPASLVKEMQSNLSSGSLSKENLSPAEWTTLVFVLLTSEGDLDVFDLKKYIKSDEGLLRLLPVIKVSQTALLDGCNLTEGSCKTLGSALMSTSNMIELDLSHNDLQNSGLQKLCDGLESPFCKVKKLSLKHCHLSKTMALAPVLRSKSSSLTELDLSDNDLQDSGVEQLAEGLCHPNCELKKLRLSLCGVTGEGCGFLVSALTANPSHMRELDLTYNNPGEKGKKQLYKLMDEPQSKLQTLSLDHDGECYLKSALKKYTCELTPDTNTIHPMLYLTLNKVVHEVEKWTDYPDHDERFNHWTQVVCSEPQSGRCYWEAEWEGYAACVGMAYRGLCRKGGNNECVIGYNDMSWSLHCTADSLTAHHNVRNTTIPLPVPHSLRIGVYLDKEGGTLSFYSVSSDSLSHLHTFRAQFTEPLYAVLWPWPNSAITLCHTEQMTSNKH